MIEALFPVLEYDLNTAKDPRRPNPLNQLYFHPQHHPSHTPPPTTPAQSARQTAAHSLHRQVQRFAHAYPRIGPSLHSKAHLVSQSLPNASHMQSQLHTHENTYERRGGEGKVKRWSQRRNHGCLAPTCPGRRLHLLVPALSFTGRIGRGHLSPITAVGSSPVWPITHVSISISTSTSTATPNRQVLVEREQKKNQVTNAPSSSRSVP